MNNNFAPIIIPTLNRWRHLKRCVESLARCKQAAQTELIIGLDYPPSERYVEGYNEMRDYLPTIKGFGKVTVLMAEHNLGAVENIVKLRKYVQGRGFDSFIFTEDDNEFSPNFLEFVNKGLELYKDDEKIMAICGYTYLNVDKAAYNSNVIAFREFSAWGYGQWTNKRFQYQCYEKEEEYRDKILQSWKQTFRLWRTRPITVNDLISMHFRHSAYGDSLCDTELALENKYCVYPSISMVRNWGHDGSGEHCSETDTYINQEIDLDDTFEFGDIQYGSEFPRGYKFGSRVADTLIIPVVTGIRYIGYRLFNKDLFSFYFKKK